MIKSHFKNIMKYIKAYKLYESIDNEDIISDIIYIMSDIIDEHKNLVFKSQHGDMSYNDYLSKNDKYKEFKPTYKAGNRLRYKFTISFNKIENYDKLSWLISEMLVVKERFNSDGWLLTKMNLANTNWDDGEELVITNLDYQFGKLGKKIASELPKEDNIVKIFNSNVGGLVTDKKLVEIYDDYTEVEFDSIMLDGEIPSNIDDSFIKVVDLLGFEEYEYPHTNKWTVKFIH